ncbi:MAG TPA: hydrophobe/amphiphile efflux-3 (HAE3) family transporter [Methanoculleus sp.]|uniref:efflux RND transporter permease subunit n=2 Tax=Methanoculleus sp. TaxID=90427 RepID=UPI001BD5DFB1|nr:hydrophobe/amphiphile efflux-3 (HAE3) family transporter [Methanoculleus sp.]HPM54841.1 hydrophobe/amphiphile efflux-3 (HAE3) family transporter [Methanoculleus sp.]HQL59029.1 hydrophobe/amphiphile efflux-3 (HAE3) family transporter [Methanoculleus sp.]
MKNPYQWLADAINNHTWAVAGVAGAIFILALFGLSMVTMETGDDTYIDKNTPRGALLAHYKDTYGSDAIMLIYEADSVRSPDALRYIDHLQEDLRNERYVDSVSGVVDLLKQANGGTLPSSKAEIDAIIGEAPPEMVERMLPSDLMTISVITLDPGVSMSAQKQVLGNIESTIRISGPPPGLSVTVSGNPAFSKEMEGEMGGQMGILILAAMLLMVLAVLLLFSHVRYSLLPVGVVAVGLIMTFGFMGLSGISISMVVIGAFPVLIGIGIDYAIQFHARFDEEIQRGTIPEAVWATVVNLGPSVLIAMSATALGFIAMFFAPVPMVADFGMVCTIGVASCYIAALIIVPVFATVMNYRPKKEAPTSGSQEGGLSFIERYDRILGRLAYTVAKHPVPVILLVAVVAAGGYHLDQSVPISADEKTFVPDDMPALRDLEKITRTMGSTSTIPIIVIADDVLSPETLAWIDQFGIYEQEHNDKITGVASIATLIREHNGGVLPSTRGEVNDVVARIPEPTLKRYLDGNMEAVLEFSTVDMEMSVARDLVKRMQSDAAWNNPPAGVTVKITGTMEMFAAVMDDIAESRTFMTLLGFAFIIGFMILVYRRFRAISPVIPIIFIVGWNGAIMYLLGLDYTPLTAVLGSMTIGVASEYTILIMERCEEELARGMEFLDAIQIAVQKIGTAITASGMTTVFGFAALTLSTFNIISNFGIVTVITVGFSLLGAIVVMPAVLSLMYRYTGRTQAPAAIGAAE